MTTRRCSTSSPAPTWRADATPAIRRRCAACARRRPIGAWRSAPRCGYPDLAGFGRRFIDIDPDELRDAVLYQLGALDAFAQVAGHRESPTSSRTARCTTPASPTPTRPKRSPPPPTSTTRRWPCWVRPGSPLLGDRRRARHGARRRGVRRPGLSRRRHAGAADRTGCGADRPGRASPPVPWRSPPSSSVTAVDGSRVDVEARSICIHGDTPGAVALARAVRAGARGARRSASTPSRGERCACCRWGRTPC